MKEPTPWRESTHTQIWNVTEKARQFGTEHREDDASLAVWFAHAPWMAAGMWHWHYVGLVHLRDLPGQSKPAVHTLPGSTHELMAYAVDPACQFDLTARDWVGLRFLRPVSIVQQFVAAHDAEALGRVEEALALCVEGRLTLESDGRGMWERLLLGRAP